MGSEASAKRLEEELGRQLLPRKRGRKPGGTNIPHHHEREEEIYLVLNGYGDMVAGSGRDGLEGRHPAKAGDAYFFRLNSTVGFYAGNKPGEEKARILGVRSLFPSDYR